MKRKSRLRGGVTNPIRFKAVDVFEAMGLSLTGGIMTLELFFRLSGIPLSRDGFVYRDDVRRSMVSRGMEQLFETIDAQLDRY